MTSMKRNSLLLFFLSFPGKDTLTLKYAFNKHLFYAYAVKRQCCNVTEKIQMESYPEGTAA